MTPCGGETLPRDGGQAVTLNVELNPKVTADLLAQAEARGLSLEEYVSEVLRERSREAVAGERPTGRMGLVELFGPLRGLEVEFSRNPSTARPVDL
jgi:hypothetical protein